MINGVPNPRFDVKRASCSSSHDESQTVWAVRDGEIYNSPALRQRLRGYGFESPADTETLARLYGPFAGRS